MSDRKPRKNAQKVLLSITALAAAAGLAGVGTYANFTGSTNAVQNVSTGTMQITLGGPAPLVNRLAIGATAFAPGDTMQRAVDLNIAGTVALTAVTLTTTDGTPSILTTDPNGLKIGIDRCSSGWLEAGGPAYTYTCVGGTVTTVVAALSPVLASRALNNLTLTAGSSNSLRVTITLPTTAGDGLQNLSAQINHLFVGTQRAGQAQ